MRPVITTIELVRRDRGLSQRELAERVGVTEGAVSRWESERRPKLDNLKRLAVALDCDPALLMVEPIELGKLIRFASDWPVPWA